jgi:hypothetical protein
MVSPTQFNHMIVAIRVPDTINLPAIFNAPQIGRLLIFDPTSETTPLGDLPEEEQGSFALLCAGDRGGIARITATAPDTNVSETTLTGALSPEGDLMATLTDTLQGQFADAERFLFTHDTPDRYRTILQERLYRSAKNVTMKQFDKDDSFTDNLLHVKVDFASVRFGQLMQQRLLVFTASISIPAIPQFPGGSERHAPVLLRASVRRKHKRIKLRPDSAWMNCRNPLNSTRTLLISRCNTANDPASWIWTKN